MSSYNDTCCPLYISPQATHCCMYSLTTVHLFSADIAACMLPIVKTVHTTACPRHQLKMTGTNMMCNAASQAVCRGCYATKPKMVSILSQWYLFSSKIFPLKLATDSPATSRHTATGMLTQCATHSFKPLAGIFFCQQLAGICLSPI